MCSCAFDSTSFSLFFFNSLEENIIPALEKIPENTGLLDYLFTFAGEGILKFRIFKLQVDQLI